MVFGESIFPLLARPRFCVHSRHDVPDLCCRPSLYGGRSDFSELMRTFEFDIFFKIDDDDRGVPRGTEYEICDPRELLCYFDHARWAPLRKVRWGASQVDVEESFLGSNITAERYEERGERARTHGYH